MFTPYPITLSQDLISLAKEQYLLDPKGIHAFSHWAKVYDNGMYLCDHEQADRHVVSLFAFFHDCCRLNESVDPDHGVRAAHFLRSLSKDVLQITQEQLDLLCYACEYHNKGYTNKDVTIGCCCGTNRLD